MTRHDGVSPLATSSYTYGFRPADLQAAYALGAPVGQPGTGPTVAIVDAYDHPTIAADLDLYRNRFGLGVCGPGCFTKVDQRGGTTFPSGNTGWGQEIALDVEMVAAVCPNCKILLVEADSNSFSDLMAAVDYAAAHANFVSNSYGAGEFSGEAAYESHFDHPGVAITVSSGDSGYGVEYPAASRYVTAVGGTTLTLDSSGARLNETAWNGAGSGCSAVIGKPAWQHDTACPRRTVADVSAVADPNNGVAVYDSYGSTGGNDWYVFGGTSVAAPIVASVYALAGTPGSGDYAAAYPYANPSSLFDITSGTNIRRCKAGYLCAAVIGYDGPTGLGSPNTSTAFSAGGGATNTPPTASFTAACSGLSCTFTDASTDSDGTVASWSWDFADGGTSTARNPSHAYSTGGNYAVTLTITDDGGAADSASQVVMPSSPTGGQTLTVSVSNDGCSAATCNFSAHPSDPDVTYSWTTGGATWTTSQTFASPGSYTVTVAVTATDGSGETASGSEGVSCSWSGKGKTKTLACS